MNRLAVTITASHGCLVVRRLHGLHQPIHAAEGRLFIVDPKSCVGISREALDLMKHNKTNSEFPVLRVKMGHDGGDIEMRLRYGGDYVLRPQWFYHSGLFEDLEACCMIIENSVNLSAEVAALEMVMSGGVGSAPRLIQEESRGAILQKYECRELDTIGGRKEILELMEQGWELSGMGIFGVLRRKKEVVRGMRWIPMRFDLITKWEAAGWEVVTSDSGGPYARVLVRQKVVG